VPFRRSTALPPEAGRVPATAIARATLPPGAGEARFRTIFEHAAIGVSVLDAAGHIVEANGAFHAFLGYAPGELIGVYAPTLSPAEDGEVTRGPVAALRAGTLASATVEKRFLRRDGTLRWASLTLTLIPLPDGEPGILGMLLDITARREAEAALAEREARLELIYNSASDLMFLMRVERMPEATGDAGVAYRCESVNEAYLAVTGLTRDQVMGRLLEEIVPAETALAVRARYAAAIASGDVLAMDEEWALPTGTIVVETTLTPVLDDHGTCTHILGAARDVSARRRAEAALRASEQALRESEARVRGAVEASLDGLFVLRAEREANGPDGRLDFAIVDCNARAAAMWSMPREALLGRRMGEVFPSVRDRGLLDVLCRVYESGEPFDGDLHTRDPRATAAWVKVHVVRVGEGVAVTVRDITEQKRVEETLRGLALVDELTGVHNRRGFLALGEREWLRARRQQRGALLVYIDLDDFKSINDAHGHTEGDAALHAVAEVLRGVFRGADVIGRLGGDEFAVLVAVDDAAALDVVAGCVQERLVRQLAASNAEARAAGRPYDLAMSVGVACAVPAAADAPPSLAALMVEADERLYAEKRARAVR
jgi:diguanylate cyclase (GGDEF)-like protein/PAS domain S-box-containing protein